MLNPLAGRAGGGGGGRGGPRGGDRPDRPDPGFTVGNSRLLFKAPYAADFDGVGVPNYDVSSDG